MTFDVEVDGTLHAVTVESTGRGAGSLRVTVDGVARNVEVTEAGGTRMSLLVGNPSEAGSPAARRSVDAFVVETGRTGALTLTVANATFETRVFGRGRAWGARRRVAGADAAAPGLQEIRAPMPGRIARVLVAPGEQVKTRQPLVVVEAMKMENELRAAAASHVKEVLVTEGTLVEAGRVLVVLEG